MTLDEMKALEAAAPKCLLYLFRHLTADEMETDPQLAFFYAARTMLPRLIEVAELARSLVSRNQHVDGTCNMDDRVLAKELEEAIAALEEP